jgi:hypothetical protein
MEGEATAADKLFAQALTAHLLPSSTCRVNKTAPVDDDRFGMKRNPVFPCRTPDLLLPEQTRTGAAAARLTSFPPVGRR